MGVMSVLYSPTVIRTDSPEVMLVTLTESCNCRPFEDVVWFSWAVVFVVLVGFKVVLKYTPNPTMSIIANATRPTTPGETALFVFANVRRH